MDFLSGLRDLQAKDFKTKWQAPSNIALVKYWGKKGHQLPSNPSISLTLSQCQTQSELTFSGSDHLSVELFLDGEKRPSFAAKIQTFLEKLASDFPVLNQTKVVVHTHNTFPHGTGIASSASGMAAVALCLADYLYFLKGKSRDDNFTKLASYFARLASGSASRSIFGGMVSWGEFAGESEMSDLFATPFAAHEIFNDLCDSVIIVSSEEKVVSSRAGHGRMGDHPYAEARFAEAHKNFKRTIDALRSGDWKTVGHVLENEALQLHALMLTSPESYTLLKPNSIFAIEKIRQWRQATGVEAYFTLDAGPNIHLLYLKKDEKLVKAFIENELRNACEQVIHDQRGTGPALC